jgi:hypothetical protein
MKHSVGKEPSEIKKMSSNRYRLKLKILWQRQSKSVTMLIEILRRH